MKKIMPVLFLAGGSILVYLLMTGKLSNVTSGANTGNAGALAGQGVQQAKSTSAAIYAQPWFWAAAVAVVGATFLKVLWGRLGGFARMTVGIGVAVAFTVFVMSVGGKR